MTPGRNCSISTSALRISGSSRARPRSVLEVERDRALAAVEQREVDAVLAELRLISAQLVALARALDLDDGGARLGQDQAGEWPGQQRREVEDGQARERLAHPPRSARCLATTARRAGAKPGVP